LKEWTTPDSRNTPSTTNLEEEEIGDAPENDGNASMPEQVKRPNLWRKMMIMMIKMAQAFMDSAITIFAQNWYFIINVELFTLARVKILKLLKYQPSLHN